MKHDLAKTLAQTALAIATQRALSPLAIVMLDAGGNIKHATVQDGAGPLRFPIAQAKAYAAIGMGMSTSDLFQLFEQGVLPDRFSASISAAADGKFAPQPGGELVWHDGNIIGSIGISGASSAEDAAVARSALRSVLPIGSL
ncbi:GlcG/HbpS family heme-binding protein [Maritalea sp.]|uniref:GlcG/HbpS family heme-binding protein n=1 Tax=Maritalea sp. TaxID=2003361 RepID=UPI003EF79B21